MPKERLRSFGSPPIVGFQDILPTDYYFATFLNDLYASAVSVDHYTDSCCISNITGNKQSDRRLSGLEELWERECCGCSVSGQSNQRIIEIVRIRRYVVSSSWWISCISGRCVVVVWASCLVLAEDMAVVGDEGLLESQPIKLRYASLRHPQTNRSQRQPFLHDFHPL